MTQIRGNQSILDKNTDAKTDSVNDMKIENFSQQTLKEGFVFSVSDFSEEEIDYICQKITPRKIRAHFRHNPDKFNKIFSGFRVASISDDSIISIVKKNITKDFVASFIRKQLSSWVQETSGYRKSLETGGESCERAMLHAIVQSEFEGNVRLYFKVTGEYQNYTEEYIALVENVLEILKEKVEEAREGKSKAEEAREGKSKAEGARDEKAENEQASNFEIKALLEKEKELSGQIIRLQQELEREKAARYEEEKMLAVLAEKNYVLDNKLKSVREEVEAAEGKISELKTELEKFRGLSKYADEEIQEERSGEYQYTSICQVYSDYKGKKCRRLADIENRKVRQFVKVEDEPAYYGNRDRLPLFDGPDTEGFVGIWDWSAVTNKKAPYKDYVHMQYNSSVKFVEIVELTECHSFEEISEWLISNAFIDIISSKVMFGYRSAENQVSGLLCGIREFEFCEGRASLKKDVYILPQYTIDVGDVFDLAGRKIYRYLNLGVPQGIFQVKSPLKVVKDIVVKRATSARLRQGGLNIKEARHCQAFLRELPEETIYQEIVDAYGCTEEDAENYLTDFIKKADSCLGQRDMDMETLGAALKNNQELIVKCKELLSEDWKAENDEQLRIARNKLEEEERSCHAFQKQRSTAQEELEKLQREISRQEKLAQDVEEKIAARIASARKDAADFISEMSFVLPCGVNGRNIPGERGAGDLSVTCRKREYLSGEEITDIDSFEEELTENLNRAGYENGTALQMAQMIVFAISSRMPIVCRDNAERIADCIAAMFGEEGVCMMAVPMGEPRCKAVCDLIERETKDAGRVFLLNGIFDGFNLNAFHEIRQCSESWSHNVVLIYPLNGVNEEMISGYVWNRTVFIDGDTGIVDFEKKTLNAFQSTVDFALEYGEKYDGEKFQEKRRLLKQFSGILDNTTLLNYTRYLTATDSTIEPNEMLLLQILMSAKASGKKEELLDVLSSISFDIKSDKYMGKYL